MTSVRCIEMVAIFLLLTTSWESHTGRDDMSLCQRTRHYHVRFLTFQNLFFFLPRRFLAMPIWVIAAMTHRCLRASPGAKILASLQIPSGEHLPRRSGDSIATLRACVWYTSIHASAAVIARRRRKDPCFAPPPVRMCR